MHPPSSRRSPWSYPWLPRRPATPRVAKSCTTSVTSRSPGPCPSRGTCADAPWTRHGDEGDEGIGGPTTPRKSKKKWEIMGNPTNFGVFNGLVLVFEVWNISAFPARCQPIQSTRSIHGVAISTGDIWWRGDFGGTCWSMSHGCLGYGNIWLWRQAHWAWTWAVQLQPCRTTPDVGSIGSVGSWEVVESCWIGCSECHTHHVSSWKHVTELRMSNVKVILRSTDLPIYPVWKSQTQSLSALLIKRSQKTRDSSWYHSLTHRRSRSWGSSKARSEVTQVVSSRGGTTSCTPLYPLEWLFL